MSLDFDVVWSVFLPTFFGIAMWLSIDLALLARAGGGRRKREVMSDAIRLAASTRSPVGPPPADLPASQPAAAMWHAQLPPGAQVLTKTVVRRAVVVVGGDLARSPRMQYHATSLCRSGLVDEVVLVGLDLGNRLSEALLEAGCRGLHCRLNTRYLIAPPQPPGWFQLLLPQRGGLRWLATTAYRVLTLTVLFTWLLLRACAVRVNDAGQLLLTEVVLVQSPPAIPFVPLLRFVVLPLTWLYHQVVHYGFLVPASFMKPEYLRDIFVELRRLHRTPSDARHGRGTPTATGSARRGGRGDAAGGGGWGGNRFHLSRLRALRRMRFRPVLFVDWHNTGHSILHADRRPWPAVALYRWVETHLCHGDVNVTVSHAMQHMLEALDRDSRVGRHRSGAMVVVLHDCAPSFFGPSSLRAFVTDVLPRTTMELMPAPAWLASPWAPVAPTAIGTDTATASHPESHDGHRHDHDHHRPKLQQHQQHAQQPQPSQLVHDEEGGEAAGHWDGRAVGGAVNLFLIAATSWTPDDDYSCVVNALKQVDMAIAALEQEQQQQKDEGNLSSSQSRPVPKVWLLVTGKGATRERFEQQVRAAGFGPHVRVSTTYFQSYTDYAAALGAADIGLCLHRSSSGLDLPMKAVDMLGAGLPVMALDYDALSELITDANGWRFRGTDDLAQLLMRLLLLTPPLSPSPSAQLHIGHALSCTAHDDTDSCSLRSAVLEEVRSKRAYVRSHRQHWESNWDSILLPVIRSVL